MITLLILSPCVLLPLTYLGMDVLSSVRAYVNGEGRWSKAQKQAVYRLERYALLRQPADYNLFLNYLAIPQGDHDARVEMDKKKPNLDRVRGSFMQGGNHPDDVDGMINLYLRFHNISYMRRAVDIWRQGDAYITQLRGVADEIHRRVTTGRVSGNDFDNLLFQVNDINAALTPLEDAFSATLGEAARWILHVLVWTTFLSTVLLLGAGLTMAFFITRHLTTNLDRLRNAATRMARGDYNQDVRIESPDELGELSRAFQEMMTQRKAAATEIDALNDALRLRVQQLHSANQELESFCYSVSHDLRAPLRAIDGFASMLQEEHAKELGPEAKRLLDTVSRNVRQMSNLIDGLLAFSRLNQRPIKTAPIDLTALAQRTAQEVLALERGHAVELVVDPLGIGEADELLMHEVFFNLLSNALKFSRHRSPAKIQVGKSQKDDWSIYFVKDNGAGFDMAYCNKLFGVFQRLHGVEEFEGTGVGLALVARIIHRHGGQVWAHGKIDEGATFYFTLQNPGPIPEGIL